MSRTLTASDRYTLIKMASTMAVGSPERKAILNGLKTAETVRGRRASVTLDDRKRHDKQTAKMIGSILDRTVKQWEDAVSTLFLNDLSKAYNQIDDFESIANRMKSRLGDIWASHIDGHGMADFYDEVADSGHYDLMEAYEAAQQEIQEMVDDGMADDGYEDAVQERMEENVLPILEDAIAQFQRDHDVSKYRVDYRRHEKEEAAARAHREDVHRQIAEMEAKIKRLRSTL